MVRFVLTFALLCAAPCLAGDDERPRLAQRAGQAKKKRAPPKRADPARSAPTRAPASAPPSTEAPAVDGASRRGMSRIEFDDRLIQGQTNKANAIYLFERRESALRSLLKKRTDFREEIDEMLER